MTALDWVLVVAIVVLAASCWPAWCSAPGRCASCRAERADAQDRPGSEPSTHAQAKVDDANAKAASVRAEAAAAKAEATAARAEARRVLEAAHSEADTILEHAHRQAESDAEQVRAAARRSRRARGRAAQRHRQGAGRRGGAPRRPDRRAGAAARRRGGAPGRAGAPAGRRMDAELVDPGDARWPTARPSWPVRRGEAPRELERIASLTADAARAELVENIEAQAKREAAILVRDIESEAQAHRRHPGPAHRGRRHPADRQRADRGERGQRPAPAERRDEGPDHRPRGPQHPGVRVGHRGQPDHRRHPRGGAAVLLRPGTPRGRPAHPGEAGPRRPDPPAPDRGGLRQRQERGRACSATGPPRRRWSTSGITDIHPELVHAAGPAALPHQLRPERAQAPGGDRAHRRDHGRRAGPGRADDEAVRRSCTTSARRSPTRWRAATR